jgi:hypothetical protein
MGDYNAPSTQENTANMLSAYVQYLPQLLQTTSKGMPEMSQGALDAAKQVSPGYAKLQTDLLNQYGGGLAQAGVDMNKVTELGQGATDTAALKQAQQPGGLLEQTRAAELALNPEAEGASRAAGTQLQNLLGSINLNGLSPNESRVVQQSLARDNAASGTTTPTATSTVSNAMTYGNALEDKRKSLEAALASASQSLPAIKSGNNNAFTTTTGRAGTAAGATPQFSGVQGQDTSATTGMAGNFLNQIGASNTSQMNNNQAGTGRTMGQITSMVGEMGKGCCWIFLESYRGTLPWWVRTCRDEMMTPRLHDGYKRMARWLVPAMRRWDLVRELVFDLIVSPITQYGGYLKQVPGYSDGNKYKGYTNFWFSVWNILGKKG